MEGNNSLKNQSTNKYSFLSEVRVFSILDAKIKKRVMYSITLMIILGLVTIGDGFFILKGSDAYATSSTLTLSVTDKLSLNISSLDSAGTFASSDTTANNISVSTNNGTGYTLGIKASTEGENALVNASDSSKTIPSHTISAGVSGTNYNDLTYASSNNLNNTWGFRPSKYYDTNNDVVIDNTSSNLYFPGPSSATNQFIIDKTTSANATANEYNIALGTRINNSTSPGKYANTFIITAVANPIYYSITYNQNTQDTVTNMPTNVVNQPTFDEIVNLSSTVPVRDGFNFKGWCTTQTTDGGTCSGTTYNPDGGGTNLTWTLDQTQSSNPLTIYAMWEVAGINLYNTVASMSKGTQTLAQLRAAITTSNSGVYEYNSSVFGTASDVANTSKIYYYRGILDNTTGSYGSNGDNAAWPNTVLLDTTGNGKDTSDTCWRIIRTTGSGGVKMIYQGKWTGSTCANATTAAQVTTSAFNGTSSDYRQIVRVGYTHNSTYATNTSQSGTIAQIFGSNSNPGANNTRSTIKTYIEDTWYANNMTSYTSKLEASAGYCNDRTMNTSRSWTTPLSESTTIASTYGTSGQQEYYFGADPRNANAAQAPSLTCGNKYSQIDRSTVDLYRYVAGSTGVSNQLKYPAALLTADEAAFAGSGYSASTTPYHANSFLYSGTYFWLLSPYSRLSGGYANGFYLGPNGDLSGGYGIVVYTYGVRPSISLTSGTAAVSGTGTATDPWIVNPDPPKYMQDVNQWKDELTTVGEQIIVVDKRDGKEYLVAKQADGNIWMTQNLDLDLSTSTTLTPANTDIPANWTPDRSTYATSNKTWIWSTTTPESYDPGNKCWNGNLNTSWNGTLDNMTQTCTSGHYHLGNYYNWTAAVAMNDSSSYTAGTQDVNQSICPAGWRLPTRDGSKSYYNLINGRYTATTSGNIQKSPVYFTYGGRWGGESFGQYVGSLGEYWTSSLDTDTADHAVMLYFDVDQTGGLGWGATRDVGFAVRCVAR